MLCNQCPRQCNCNRAEGEQGFCQAPYLPVVAKAMLHHWEEPCISGTKGSGAIFFSGCSLRCVYCQNHLISHQNKGEVLSVEQLADLFRSLEAQGAHNINLVTGTHFVDAIIAALDLYRPKIPIVYNSSGYESLETMQKLNGYIDIYLLDLKYLSSQRALRYSGAADYPEYAKKAILEAKKQTKQNVSGADGILQKGLIIRHLLLPQGTAEAIDVLHWVNENIDDAIFSLMRQYTPCNDLSKYHEINRRITRREYEKVLSSAQETSISTIYVQQNGSADKQYIPAF